MTEILPPHVQAAMDRRDFRDLIDRSSLSPDYDPYGVFDGDEEPLRCEGDYVRDGQSDVCLAPLDGRGRCTRPGGRHDPQTGMWAAWGEQP